MSFTPDDMMRDLDRLEGLFMDHKLDVLLNQLDKEVEESNTEHDSLHETDEEGHSDVDQQHDDGNFGH